MNKNFSIKSGNDLEKALEMAGSFLKRAEDELGTAREKIKGYSPNYPQIISLCQKCVEFSIKAIFLLLGRGYPRDHKFREEEFEFILKNIPEKLEYLGFPKLYLYSEFWEKFRTIADYGYEKLGIGADKLFDKEEAELALKHAEKCRYAASHLKNYKEHPW